MVELCKVFFAVGIIVLQYHLCAPMDQRLVGSGCIVQGFSTVRCRQDFNLTHFIVNYNSSDIWNFRNLEILDTNLLSIDKTSGFEFQRPFLFQRIYIHNAPKLSCIDTDTISVLSDSFTHFRAIGTNLPDYNNLGRRPEDGPNPFAEFSELNQVFVGKTEGACSDPTILFPCTCVHGKPWLTEVSGLYSTSSSRYDGYGNLTGLTCDDDSITGKGLFNIFRQLTPGTHFDSITIRSSNITHLPENVFSDSSITAVSFDKVPNLSFIHPGAFASGGASIQILEIDGANFSAAKESEVGQFFMALSSLVNLRNLRLSSCGIPFVPNSGFVPRYGQRFHNLRYLSISFDRRVHSSGLSRIGSYAFSGAPKLKEIGLGKNFISKFESFSFGFNETRQQQLRVYIGRNPFNDSTGLEPNAFSGSRGPLWIKYDIDSFAASDPANDPQFHFLPEDVFRPFLDEHQKNALVVDYFNVEIWCDGGSQWMFDSNGVLKPRVQNGIKIVRVDGNVISSWPDSIRCKAESSFESVPPCLLFPAAGLVHCGGNFGIDIAKTFKDLEGVNFTGNFSSLVFSTKGVEEIPKNLIGNFRFTHISFLGARDLKLIHPGAFGASTETIQEFEANGTCLKTYPNFGSFPNLLTVKLDDAQTFHLTKSSFDYTQKKKLTAEKNISIYLSNGTIDHSTFESFGINGLSALLIIGARKECDTIACQYSCTPVGITLVDSTFRPFLDANPKNQIQTTCYLECSCELKWLFQNWKTYATQVSLWWLDGPNRFFCVVPGNNVKDTDSFLGIDISKFNYGEYFTKNC